MTDIPNVETGLLEGVREQARSAGDRPVGGILLGWVEGDALSVERAVPATDADEHAGELVFTSASWDAAYAALEGSGPESKIVGWYHAHPSHGATLSEYDRSLHRTLFSEPSQVALVIDPKTGDVAWFGWQVERIGPLPTGQAEPAAAMEAGTAADVAATAKRPRRRIGALVALLLAGAAVGGYLWGNSLSKTKVVTRTAPGSSAQLQQARTLAEQIRAQLMAESARAAAVQAQLEATQAKLGQATDRLKSRGQPKKGQPMTFLYHVRPGDSMAALAQLFFGNWKDWPKIWHANPSPDPNRILVGTWLKIPLQSAG